MATFTNFNDRLPDPTFTVGDSGAVGSGVAGPGFASATVRSVRDVNVARTRSGRGVHSEEGTHYWEIDINYNPMRRDQFDIVSGFLESRHARMYPFYVVLPQYSKPKDTAFATFTTSNIMRTAGAQQAGTQALLIDAAVTVMGTPRIGDYFTITDSTNVNHTKAYKVVGVENNALYRAGTTQPTTAQLRLQISPELTRYTADNSVINWHSPKFRVVQKSDVIESNLNTDNLYQYSLSLEEMQP